MSEHTPVSNRIFSMWVEGALREVDYVCLRSMVRAGLDVTLYHYGPIENVPDGVRLANGQGILDIALMKRLKMVKRSDRPWQVNLSFSDIFRIMGLKKGLGLWLDTDVFVFRYFEYEIDKPFFFKEDRKRIGASVFYVPAHSPIIAEYDRLLEQDTLMPNWLGPWRGIVRPTWWKLTGQAFSPPDLGITIYGNDAFTRLAKRHGCYDAAGPKQTFYYWAASENEKLFDRQDFSFFLDSPEILGIHIHRKHRALEPVISGSFWEWARQQ